MGAGSRVDLLRGITKGGRSTAPMEADHQEVPEALALALAFCSTSPRILRAIGGQLHIVVSTMTGQKVCATVRHSHSSQHACPGNGFLPLYPYAALGHGL